MVYYRRFRPTNCRHTAINQILSKTTRLPTYITHNVIYVTYEYLWYVYNTVGNDDKGRFCVTVVAWDDVTRVEGLQGWNGIRTVLLFLWSRYKRAYKYENRPIYGPRKELKSPIAALVICFVNPTDEVNNIVITRKYWFYENENRIIIIRRQTDGKYVWFLQKYFVVWQRGWMHYYFYFMTIRISVVPVVTSSCYSYEMVLSMYCVHII